MRGGRWCVGLPQEIEFEILLNLSVRDLCRLKCVCIRWRDTIDSDGFREEHYALQNNSALFCFYDYIDNGYRLQWDIFSGDNLTIVEHLNTQEPEPFAEVVGPCRGLFLLLGGLSERDGNCPALYNPVTGHLRLLPSIPYETKKYSYVYGLGWDPYSNDYKVVFYHYRHQVAFVYTFRTGSWLSCPEVAGDSIRRYDLSLYPSHYIHISGFCYWLSDFKHRPSILSFDVVQEVFATLVVPYNVPRDYGYFSSISAYHDSLAFLAYQEGQDFEVWVLQQQCSWTKVFSFRLNCRAIYSVEGIWKNTHVLLKTKSKQGYPRVILYNMSNHKTVKVAADFNSKRFLNYKESLFWVREEVSPASPHLYYIVS